ncbi:AfsR/SARP family transcriptional regulator [Actinomadura rubrisoli]|uniref:Tetratricopeptide repeat protein n=1 Tax=Actinomadura rubrisoli TaxID=2530368 RepID=A0A4R5ATA4_9ACTN|nr:tetratricopeptide repeat protein [Actinomadura rubrisoli]TDD76488.1 tetratricopeptide repeat protein [Actinomadura rubrisoli]
MWGGKSERSRIGAKSMNFKILGPLEIWGADKRLHPGTARHQKVLSALLLAADQVVPVSRLINAAWDEDPPATATKQARNVVSDLRRVLNGTGAADLVTAGQGGYRLSVGPGALDAFVFDDQVTRARKHAVDQRIDAAVGEFRAALALWRGPTLAGLDSPALAPQRIALDEKRLAVLEECTHLELTLGRHHALSAELVSWVAEFPLRERLVGLYMRALYQSGRQAEALRAFQEARRVLIEQLGIEPGKELQHVHQQILTGDAEIVSPSNSPAEARHFLPRDIADFTGRTAELERLFSALPADGEPARAVVISAIDGMAGIGKTTLAVHAAHHLADRYPDAQLFVDLHAHSAEQDPVSASTALDTLLRALGVPGERIPEGVEKRAGLWRAQLAGRRAVVVLDNAAGAAQVRPLLPGTPECAVLITSRRRLVDLEAAHPLSLDVLPSDDATALFTRVIGDTRALADSQDVQEVVRLCGYLPLAIRVAAARLRTRPAWGVAHLIERLRHEQRRLGELAAGDRGVAAAFALSYRYLTGDQQRLFRLLGLHPGADFDTHTAAALADVTLEQADRLMEQLVDVHLLQQPTADRYRFHQLLRLHAVHLADIEEGEAERRAALTRAFDHYRHTTGLAMNAAVCYNQPYSPSMPASTTPAPHFADFDQAVAWLETEWPNLVTAATYAAEHGWPLHVADLANRLWCYIEHRCSYDEAVVLYTSALQSARDNGDREHESQALHYLGLFHRRRGRGDQALAHYGQALTLARDTGNRILQARILGNLGPALRYLGRADDALVHYGQALTLARDIGDLALQCGVLKGLGSVYRQQGRYDQAVTYYKQSLALTRDVGNHRHEPVVLCELGGVYGRIGRFDEALVHLHEALDMARASASRLLEGSALCELGGVYGRTGRHDEALSHLHEALDLARATANSLLEGSALCEIGDVCGRTGRYDEALSHLGQAVDLACGTANRPLENEVLNRLGETVRRTGDPNRARAHHQEALAIAGEIGDRYEQARAHDGLAHAHHDLGHHRQAREHRRQALAGYTDLGVPDAGKIRALPETPRPGASQGVP